MSKTKELIAPETLEHFFGQPASRPVQETKSHRSLSWEIGGTVVYLYHLMFAATVVALMVSVTTMVYGTVSGENVQAAMSISSVIALITLLGALGGLGFRALSDRS